MNKLDVALRLLQLLNERKTIDSRIVAHELSVSLRTAQRYLMELSFLPCVSSKSQTHTYSLNTEYQLNDALKGSSPSDYNELVKPRSLQKLNIPNTVCLVCGNKRGNPDSIASMNILLNEKNSTNISKIDRLTAIIAKRLKHRQCSFP